MFVHIHSGFRYLALLAGLAVIGYGLWSLVTGRGHVRRIHNLAAAYRVLMDLTLFLGVAVLFSGRFYPAVGTHMVVMLLAVIVAHIVPAVMRKRPKEERTITPYVVATAASLALVILGTVMLGQPPIG
jgi:hypothetical protein